MEKDEGETAEKIINDMINVKPEKHHNKKDPWKTIALILGILCIIFLTLILKPELSGKITGSVVSGGDAADNLIEFAKIQLPDVELLNVEEESGLYKVTFTSDKTGETSAYTSLDGKYIITGIIPLESVKASSPNSPEVKDVPKSDKPEVNLFIMTHCPYGTQAEKGMIPVLKTLGDKIDAKIRFVHYFMHGAKEEQETYKQICIREEQNNKYLSYLSCFLEDSDTERCLDVVGIDKDKLNECIVAGRNEQYYSEDSELSETAGVKGSPTLVINGEIVQSGRSPAEYLSTICSAFNTAPSECSQELSTQTYEPGFGYEHGADTTAQC